MTDALGNLVRFVLLPGQRYDTVGVAPLIQDIEFGALIADKAFASNWIIENLNERGAGIIISQRPQRLKPLVIDAEMYKWRHLVENFFGMLKDFKCIAMRADKTDQSFEAMTYLCSAVINSRRISTSPSSSACDDTVPRGLSAGSSGPPIRILPATTPDCAILGGALQS